MSQELLQWYMDAGVDECIADQTYNHFGNPINISIPTISPPKTTQTVKTSPQMPSAPPQQATQSAVHVADQATTLSELKNIVTQFEGCPLRNTATHTVFGVGLEKPDVMFIGEAPGADEDRQGEPFVGVSGKLLDKMMASIGLDRTKNAYISNLLPWRPPGNRNPTSSEIAVCLPFIKKHIELVQPKIIVFLGGAAAAHLLDLTEGITRMRGKWYNYNCDSTNKVIPAMPTFHPAYLLRSPIQKKKTWHDLLEIKNKLSTL